MVSIIFGSTYLYYHKCIHILVLQEQTLVSRQLLAHHVLGDIIATVDHLNVFNVLQESLLKKEQMSVESVVQEQIRQSALHLAVLVHPTCFLTQAVSFVNLALNTDGFLTLVLMHAQYVMTSFIYFNRFVIA